METSFKDYQSFDTIQEARAFLTDLLDENQIPYEIGNTKSEAEFITSRPSFSKPVTVQLAAADFEKVNKLLEANATPVTEIPKNHFFRNYTTAELEDAVHKPFEWNAETYAIARKVLEDRGIKFTNVELTAIKKKRLEELAKPQKANMGFMLIAFTVSLAGVIAGIFYNHIYYVTWPAAVILAGSVAFTKKTLPNGQSVPMYDQQSRSRAFIVLVLSVMTLLIFGIAVIIYSLA